MVFIKPFPELMTDELVECLVDVEEEPNPREERESTALERMELPPSSAIERADLATTSELGGIRSREIGENGEIGEDIDRVHMEDQISSDLVDIVMSGQ